MVWAFSHDITVGDVIVARKGLQTLMGVGEVLAPATYMPERNPNIDHPRWLSVSWRQEPRGRRLPEPRSNWRPTVVEISPEIYETVLDGINQATPGDDGLVNGTAFRFAYEEELQNFIVGNWRHIFPNLDFYEEDGAVGGVPFETTDVGAIDILAVDRTTNDFVVIELKRNRSSDVVVGQMLRYMGWVKKNLCNGRGIRGLIICREHDRKLTYAASMLHNVELKYYKVTFELVDGR
jgi:restriction system protein